MCLPMPAHPSIAQVPETLIHRAVAGAARYVGGGPAGCFTLLLHFAALAYAAEAARCPANSSAQ
jgi:hypothetical protein